MQFDTSVEFDFIGNSYQNLEVILGDLINTHKFAEGNSFKIGKGTFKNEKNIVEFNMFEIGNDETLCSFRTSIYDGITNHIYYDNNQKTPAPTIEMIFFGKKFLPNKIKYKGIELKNFDYNGNKYRRRICIVNADPNELEYLNDDKFKQKGFKFENKSYQVIIRIAENNNIHYSVSLLDKKDSYLLVEDDSIETSVKSIEQQDIKELEKFCIDFKAFIKNIYQFKTNGTLNPIYEIFLKNLKSLNDQYNIIAKKKIFEYLSNPLKYQKIQNFLKLVHYSHNLFLYKAIFKNINDIFIFYSLKNYITNNNNIERDLYENLYQDTNLSDEEKIKFLKVASTILIKLTLASKSAEKIDYINIDNIKKNNPYYKARELVKNIVEHLDEDSRLFEAFLNFNSGTIQNLLEETEPKKYILTDAFGFEKEENCGKYKSEFGLSLLNFEQVKLHLMKLLPKLIIRIDCPINFRAYYDKDMSIMIVNEIKLFGKNIETMNLYFEEKDSDKFIIPINMEILHEMLSHGKIRIIDKEEKSPRFFRDSIDNFEYKSILKLIEIDGKEEIIPVPESGRILENFISKSSKVINNLKTPLIENNIFLDYKFWVKQNFEFIENIIKQRKNNADLLNNNILYDELILDQDDCYIDRGETYNL